MIVLALSLVLAAGSDNPDLAEGIHQLRGAEWAAALKSLEKARWKAGGDPEQLAQVYMYLGMARAALLKDKESLENFKSARALDPWVRMPSWASPPVRERWRSVGGEIEGDPPHPPHPPGVEDLPIEGRPPPKQGVTPLRQPQDEALVETPPKPVVKVGEPPPTEVTVQPAAAGHRRYAWVPGLVAVLAGVVGTVTYVFATDDYNQLTSTTMRGVANGLHLKDEGNALQWTAFTAFFVCGAALLAAVGLLVFGGGE